MQLTAFNVKFNLSKKKNTDAVDKVVEKFKVE